MMRFKIIGGDRRFEILKEILVLSGHTYDPSAHIIILPLPLSRDGRTLNAPACEKEILLSDIIEQADEGDIFLGGLVDSNFAAKLEAAGAVVFDYNARDEFAQMNAVPTAEGAVSIAIENTDYSLFGSNCLVAGYGKIGKVLSSYLKALGASVTVSARKEADFELAKASEVNHIHSDSLADHIDRFTLIFNTVPHRIFDKKVIDRMNQNTLYIELASAPYGIDFDEAKAAGIELINAPSLPAKVAPVTAAKNIKNTIFNILREEFS